MGKKKPSHQTTSLLLNMAWRMEKVKSFFTSKKPLLTRDSARVAQSKTYFENAKLLAALPGFSFTSLERSIAEASKKYLNGKTP